MKPLACRGWLFIFIASRRVTKEGSRHNRDIAEHARQATSRSQRVNTGHLYLSGGVDGMKEGGQGDARYVIVVFTSGQDGPAFRDGIPRFCIYFRAGSVR